MWITWCFGPCIDVAIGTVQASELTWAAVCLCVLQHVELRVKGAIARRDETIVQLQQELAVAVEALRGTEAVLAAQQEELCD